MKRIPRVLSFSNMVAMLALFVALGGSVYAASGRINGAKIKPKSIPGNRIKARSLSGNQFKAKTLTGAKIKPRSLTGKQVVGSSLTGVNAVGLASVHYATTTILLARRGETGTTTTASCPAGMKVIGGGAVVSNDAFASVADSGPLASRTGWESTARTSNDGMTMTVTAICMPVAAIAGSDRQEREENPPRVLYP